MGPDRRVLDRGQDVAADEVLLALHDHREAPAADARALGGTAVVHDLDEVARRERQPEDATRPGCRSRGPAARATGATTRPVSRRSRRIALPALIGKREADRVCASSEMNVLMPDDVRRSGRRAGRRSSRVDRRVGLDHRLLGEAGQDAVEAAHDAAGHRLLEAHRVADRDDLVADAQRRRNRPAAPRAAATSVSIRRSARSVTVSMPSTRRRRCVPESSVTDSEAAPSTTCALVSTWPSRSMSTPGADHGLEPPLRLGLVDLGDLDRHDAGRDSFEERGQRLGARLLGEASLRDRDQRREQRRRASGRMIHRPACGGWAV